MVRQRESAGISGTRLWDPQKTVRNPDGWRSCRLEYHLSIPTGFSAAFLGIVPELISSQGHPRFEALLDQDDVVF